MEQHSVSMIQLIGLGPSLFFNPAGLLLARLGPFLTLKFFSEANISRTEHVIDVTEIPPVNASEARAEEHPS